jgi:UDP-N-acetylmuramoyl-L-alanyl-D-glutamate--2,6-diaminopimelate ligase
MIIKELFKNIEYEIIAGSADADVRGIAIDSRLVKQGDMFVATVGREADGHDYIPQAIAAGAASVLIEDTRAGDYAGYESTVVAVADTRAVLSKIVNRFHGDPSRKFRLIGITGTNGKTSTAALTNHILRSSGHRTGLLGTIENLCDGKAMDIKLTTPTTPDCVELGEIMKHMADAGVDDLIMEVSSMGLKMGRVSACDFDIGVFTNISPEHLDDHGNMEDYTESKLILFDIAKDSVINMDDPAGEDFARRARGKVTSFGKDDVSRRDLYAENIEYSAEGVAFDMVYVPRGGGETRHDMRGRVEIATPAEFAVYNALAAVGVCLCAGVGFYEAVSALNEKTDIAGRYQVMRSADGVTAIIDYAHTAKALENLLGAVRGNPAYSRLISVFGCGGDRDPGKRAPMGAISGRLADYTYITSDNPRTEDPLLIITQVESGMKSSGGAYEIVPDRAEAISRAILEAKPKDAVVIAGKGHEDYQIIGREKIHLDDREIAAESLTRRETI